MMGRMCVETLIDYINRWFINVFGRTYGYKCQNTGHYVVYTSVFGWHIRSVACDGVYLYYGCPSREDLRAFLATRSSWRPMSFAELRRVTGQ
jgi:hypothetical protein